MKKNTFAEACYDMNSIDELIDALKQEPDESDMKTWGLSADEWRENIEIALKEKIQDLPF